MKAPRRRSKKRATLIADIAARADTAVFLLIAGTTADTVGSLQAMLAAETAAEVVMTVEAPVITAGVVTKRQ